MLKVRVAQNVPVMIGDLEVRAEITESNGVRLIAKRGDGAHVIVTPPVTDLAPSTLIKAERFGKKVALAIAAPRDIPIRVGCATRFGAH